MKLKLEVGDKTWEGNIKDVVAINEGSLNEEFTKQPSLYAWFAVLSEIANAEVYDKEFQLSRLEANLNKEKRAQLDGDGKKVTEAMVKAEVESDNKYVVLRQEILESQRQYGILKALVKALDTKKDMLMQLGSHKRQEIAMGDFGINIEKIRQQNKG